MPSNPLSTPGVGSVTTYFSTFNGSSGTLLIQSSTGIVSGELRPRSSTPGLYEGGYAQVTPLVIVDYGSYTVSVPTTDSDSNGIPDVLQFDRDGNFTASGSGFSPAAGLTFSISVRFSRNAGTAIGSYTATTQNVLGQANSVNGVYNILTYQGSVTYTRGSTNTMAITAKVLSQPDVTLAGSTSYTITNSDQISYPSFTIRSNSGTTYQVRAGMLSRSGNVYRGNFSLADGLPQTSWADFTEYVLAISDTNDSDGNGIPDFSDTTAAPPVIITQPRATSATVGQSVSLSVVATGATSYQWTKDGADIPGATSAILSLQSAQLSDSGTYAVKTGNAAGLVVSSAVVLTITPAPPPIISTHPQSTAVAIGGNATLSVQVAGSNLTYQWLLNDIPIVGSTSSILTLTGAQPTMGGNYAVRVSNGVAFTISNVAIVTVGSAQLISDDFSGTSVDTASWTAVRPFSDSRTDINGGMLTLRNRGRLLSKAATSTDLSISTRFRFSGSSYDQFAVFLRTNGSTTNGSFDSGVSVEFQLRSGDQGATGISNIKIYAKNVPAIAGSYSLTTGTWYDATIDDDGSAIVVRINGKEVVRTQTNVRTGNLVGIQNREGLAAGSSISAGSATDVDFIRITSSASNGTPGPTPRLANISTRGFVGTGNAVMICGFVVQGSNPQRVLIRASGPALRSFGLSDVLPDPQLTLRSADGTTIASNNDWDQADATAAQGVGAFPFPAGSKDSAVVQTLTPGVYTVEIADTSNTNGTALVEAYDLDPANQRARVINISTRGSVTSTGQPVISGLVVSGAAPRLTLVRAVGPTLADFGVSGVLDDPVLAVYSSTGAKLLENDDWSASESPSSIAAASTKVGAFALRNSSKDSALLLYLPPGPYTFVVSGKGTAAGVTLLEAYEVN
jgi:hypothetical protein